MKYSLDKQDKYAVLSLHEDNMNSLLAPALKYEFKVLSETGVPNFVLNIADVKFVDSSGLSAILTAKRLWEDVGTFVLTGVNSNSVKKLIEISKLDNALNIIPTVDESIDYIFMDEIERELDDDSDE